MLRLPHSATVFHKPRLGLQRCQRIKVWMRSHEDSNRLEYEAFDAVLTLWVMGWVGLLPSLLLQQWWLVPLCWLAVKTPSMYVNWRIDAHTLGRLRCDWIDAARQP